MRWSPSWGTSEALRDVFDEVRRDIERDDPESAWRQLAPLAAADPDNLDARVWLQELELELLQRRSRVDPALAAIGLAATPEDALRRVYAERAEQEPSAANLILAARLESDALAAENLLDRALLLDPRSAWGHYGKAHAILLQTRRLERWGRAQEELGRALAIDAGHVRARRLEAWMRAQEGAAGKAADALVIWLEATREDPRVSKRQRIEAEVDLATLWILDGDADDARELLRSLEGTTFDRPRRLSALAAAQQAEGQPEAALDTARRAAVARDRELLPLVQQALLYQFWLDEPESAAERWTEVVQLSEGQAELASLLQSLRAKVMLERLTRERTGDAADLEGR